MLNKLLAPLDGSSLATIVLPHVTALAQAADTHVTLLHVLDPATSAMTAVNPIDWHLRRTETQAYMDEVMARLSDFIPGQVDSVVLEGRAADQIVAFARQGAYDLTVISSHGQSGLTDWNLSSVTNKVIDKVGESVLLVRADRASVEVAGDDWSPTIYRRILLPLDGSLRAEYVLPFAKALAQQHKAELILVHVVAQPEMIQRTPLSPEQQALMEEFVEQNQTQAASYLESVNNRLDVPVTAHVLVSSNVSAALYEFATRETIDLVLLTAHGSSGLNQRPYGSLASGLLVYGAMPVMVLQDMPSHDRDQSDSANVDDVTRKPGLSNHNAGYPIAFANANHSLLWRPNHLTSRRPLQLG